MKIKEIIDTLEEIAPLNWQEDYDNAGLTLGDKNRECSGVYICLDVFASSIREAIHNNCNLIVSHHPFIFHGIKKLIHNSEEEQILELCLKHNIALYATHTNMDSSAFGVNYILARQLEFASLTPLDNSRFVNEKNYLGSGAIGKLQQPMKAKNFLLFVKDKLNIQTLHYIGNEEKIIKKVGICGGSGSFLIEKAVEKHCDVFITGDIKYHDYLTFQNDIILADIGHFESEQFIKEQIFNIISKKFTNFATLLVSKEKNRIKFL